MHALASLEDYQAAAAIRDELNSGSLDDDAKVLSATREFYEAVGSKDIKRIEPLWLDASHVRCLHPGDDWSVGYKQVIQSLGKLFRGKRFLKGTLCVEDVRMNVRGPTATVVCRERLRCTPKWRTLQYNATNVFQKVSGRWLLVLRHVSPSQQERVPSAVTHGRGSWASLPEMFFLDESDHEDEDDDDESGGAMAMLSMGQLEDPDSHGELESDSEVDAEMDEPDSLVDARDTVRALRRLSAEERLPKLARLHLLEEMLRDPGVSMPERAHDLLLRDVPAEEAEEAWEDFANLMAMEAKRLTPRPPRQADGRRQAM